VTVALDRFPKCTVTAPVAASPECTRLERSHWHRDRAEGRRSRRSPYHVSNLKLKLKLKLN
jgi:hypothetical protein